MESSSSGDDDNAKLKLTVALVVTFLTLLLIVPLIALLWMRNQKVVAESAGAETDFGEDAFFQ